tara:strand:+ start:31813 stop:33684 length:1872 start_codon:yes stop_codon:yes gene_type:complete
MSYSGGGRPVRVCGRTVNVSLLLLGENVSLLLSREDLDFIVFDWLRIEELLESDLYKEHDVEVLRAVLELSERLATDLFYTHSKIADSDEPGMQADGEVRLPAETKSALRALADAGLIATSMPVAVGGMQLPFMLDKAAFAWFQAANAATSGYALLSMAAANLLIEHGSDAQIATYVPRLANGTDFATMCLSEPQAGSSLSDIKTTARNDAEGFWRLTGNKMWISGGDHQLSESITHLVLARTEGAQPGVRGLSLFIVPKFFTHSDGKLERNDVIVAGLNHKMGQRGTVNAALNFGEGRFLPNGKPGAIGYLIGELGSGLTCMFTMMNEARIAVGTSAAAIGYTGYLHALDYARNRPQGRHPNVRDPESPPVAIVEHTDVKRMLLTQKAFVEGALALNLYCARLVDELRVERGYDTESAKDLLELLTPVAKSWPSKFCLEANDLAIQVHGGYGYTRDFNVERLYRDNRLNPIHEGTHGIQAIDLLARKVKQNDGRALLLFEKRIRETCARASAKGKDCAIFSAQILVVLERLIILTRELGNIPDMSLRLANASLYLDTFGHLTIAWIWLDKLVLIGDRSGLYFDGKRAAGAYFMRYELPKTLTSIDLLSATDRTILDMRPESF